jgi:serine/threonine protein kinase
MNPCPPREILKRFLAGKSEEREQEAMCAHAEECLACQAELENLVAGPSSALTVIKSKSPRLAGLYPPFLERLEQTEADPSWRPPPWIGSRPCGGVALEPDSPPSESRPVSVPGYEILGELGRGAMGVVYKARQLSLGRLTALKMILAGPHASLNDQTRFRAEAEWAAWLRHPNIVQVYEIGETDGLLYFSMELVEGETLKQWLRGAPQPSRTAARLLELLARAVGFAHRRGIVHRDLKPANVLLEPVDAQPAAGSAGKFEDRTVLGLVPKITDFGLAKRLGDTLGTQTGQIMGTPSYMPPEQLLGRGGATGTGVDIYALGSILYETLTGRPPFLDESLEALAERVLHEEPIPPRRLQPQCPRDLEIICLKCLEKEPQSRYATADELGDDLARFLAREPIRARPPSILDRCIKFTRRHRALVASVSAVIVALALGITATSVMALREFRARRDADRSAQWATESAQKEQTARVAARREAYQARLTASLAALGMQDIHEAGRQLAAAPQEFRSWEWRHLEGRLDQSLSVVALPPGVRSIAFCPAGEQIAVTEGKNGYCILDAVTGRRLAERQTASTCRQVYSFMTSGGPRLVLDESVQNLSFAISDDRGAALGRVSLPESWCAGWPPALAMSPDGRWLALQTSSYEHTPLVELFSISTGRRERGFGGIWASLRAVEFSPDSKQLVAVHQESW